MRRIMFAKRFARSERGSTLAELAILVPFLIIMAASVAELGRLFQSYTSLSKSTRAAARYLSAKTYADNIQPARNIALCGKTDCTGTEPVVKGLQISNIVVDPEWKNGVAGGTLTRVTVRVEGYNFQPMFNLAGMLNMEEYASLPVRPSTTMYYMLTNTTSASE